MAKLVICNAVLAAALVLASCGVGGSLGPASLEDQQARAQAATTTPHLQPGEKIRINVFGEFLASGDYEIDQSGFVSLPLAGTIKAAGFTQPEARAGIGEEIPLGVSPQPQSHGHPGVAAAILHCRRSRETW